MSYGVNHLLNNTILPRIISSLAKTAFLLIRMVWMGLYFRKGESPMLSSISHITVSRTSSGALDVLSQRPINCRTGRSFKGLDLANFTHYRKRPVKLVDLR